MKKAHVHDWIFHIGWAEAVFFELIQEQQSDESEGRIFTLYSNLKSRTVWKKTYKIVTPLPHWLNTFIAHSSKKSFKWSISNKLFGSIFDYRNLIVFYPQLCRILKKKIDVYNPDSLMISSFAAVKNIVTPTSPQAKTSPHTTLYLHSPNQYIRENYDEYVKRISWWKGWIFRYITPRLRRWDALPRAYDAIYTNSAYTKQTAQKHYSWFENAEVRYPAIDKKFASASPPSVKKDYFVCMWRLTTFVREVDKIIQLCNETQQQLIVMWSWPDELYLKSLAGDTITFVGKIDDGDTKVAILKQSRWLINLAKESCGLSTMEALALWIPVFGYKAWGTAELVGPDQWLLVDQKDMESLRKGFEEFRRKFG